MSHLKRYIALDLGGSARCVMGSFSGNTLTLDDVSRFENSYTQQHKKVTRFSRDLCYFMTLLSICASAGSGLLERAKSVWRHQTKFTAG
jgi:hypothetical protein